MKELANSLIIEIKEVLKTARQNAARQINAELLTAWMLNTRWAASAQSTVAPRSAGSSRFVRALTVIMPRPV
ncbi:MAG: hypothetical protein LBS18_08175 [Clostridiales bacterium]|nr:hypothetical protein [Clostridiales bacterium]